MSAPTDPPSGRVGVPEWGAWVATLGGVTAAMVAARDTLAEAHVALGFLLLVLCGSARGGLALGAVLALGGFLSFNFYFLPPLHTLVIHDPLDWFVLFAYLAVALVGAQLLARAQRLAAEAERAEALREAHRLKDALLASVSHDLRTPLTTIKALARDLAETGDERAAIIEEEADRLNRFVGNLLDLSRLDAGALPLQPELIAAEDLLGAALQRVTPALHGREVLAALDPNAPLAVGRFDFVQSLRVLVNLIENAHKFAPAGTPIEIDVRRAADQLVFRVMDRGPGIPRAEQQTVFEPFRRARDVSPDTGGAGLGLSIARRLAEAQGGELRYEPRIGGGSVLVFALPAEDLKPETGP